MDKEFLFSCRLLGTNEHFTFDELKSTYRQCAENIIPAFMSTRLYMRGGIPKIL
jgi:hypothetical protein